MKKMLLFTLALTAFCARAQSNKTYLNVTIDNRNSDTLMIINPRFDVAAPAIADSTGTFRYELEIIPTVFGLYDSKHFFTVYLKPGDYLNVHTNADDFIKKLSFSGSGAKENYIWKKFNLAAANFEKVEDSLKLNPKALKIAADEHIKEIKSWLDEKNIDPGFYYFFKSVIESRKTALSGRIQALKYIGRNAPSFYYEDPEGNVVKNKDFKGQYVFIDVWATWCVPCLNQIPYLERLAEKYNGRITFVSISVDGAYALEKWQTFIKSKNLKGTQLIAKKGFDSSFMNELEVSSIPRFIIIAPDGTVVEADAPRPSDPELDSLLAKLLD